MTSEDKAEFRAELKEILHEHISGIIGIQDAKEDTIKYRLDSIENKLDKIEIQTTKTNGRVTALEKSDMMHYANCPNVREIKNIQNSQMKRAAVNQWLERAVLIAISIAGCIFGYFQIHKK